MVSCNVSDVILQDVVVIENGDAVIFFAMNCRMMFYAGMLALWCSMFLAWR